MNPLKTDRRVPGSFRDPSGFLFHRAGTLLRKVSPSYRVHYEHLMSCGLYRDLATAGLLIPHEESPVQTMEEDSYKLLKPEPIPFISYPYEWCFSQLKDAALLTLQLQKTALRYGMSLKDASAYNVQFRNGKPVWIDTLSFETYEDGKPWIAYEQFCRHFLAPLALMDKRDIRLSQLLRVHVDGIPLDLASRLLGLKAFLQFPLFCHIHLHAKNQQVFERKLIRGNSLRLNKGSFLNLIHHLEQTVLGLRWNPCQKAWANYYSAPPYSDSGFEAKKAFVSACIEEILPKSVWDLGANTGTFSRLASTKEIETLSVDQDPASVELNYRQVVAKKENHLLPLWMDLANPSPGMGWENEERSSLTARGPADLVLALALIHHLIYRNHVPLDKLASFFCKIATFLILEFVPSDDAQVSEMISRRGENTLPDYSRTSFERVFGLHFDTMRTETVPESGRVLYFLKRKDSGHPFE